MCVTSGSVIKCRVHSFFRNLFERIFFTLLCILVNRLMSECLGSLPSEETGDDARKASDFYRNSLPISSLFSDQCLHLKHGLGIEVEAQFDCYFFLIKMICWLTYYLYLLFSFQCFG